MTAVSIILTLALSVTEGSILVMLMPLLSMVGIEKSSSMPRVANWLESAFGLFGLTPTLGSTLILFVGIAGVRALLLHWQSAVNAKVREGVSEKMRLLLYRSIAGAEWKFLVTRRPSEFVHALASETGRVGAAAYQLIDLGIIAAVSLVYLALAFHFSAVMALVVLVCASALAWVLKGSLIKARRLGAQGSTARTKLHAVVTEHIAALKTAKSYGATDRQDDIFLNISADVRDVNLETQAGQTELQQRLELGCALLLAFIVYVSYQKLGVSAAQLLVLLFVFARLMPRMVSIYQQIQRLVGVLPIIESVNNLEQECIEAAETLSRQKELPRFNQNIRFDGVSFAYLRRTEAAALQSVDLQIEAGRTTAIVGPSGAGKSTLADLLIGLLSPSSGRILIDGEVLTTDRLASWRQQVSYVPQETFLFHDTVRANLDWASAGVSEDQLIRALRLSAAYDFVSNLPQGLDTIIGERGVLVSGGERQRLSLARAILRRPGVLVLDEATSSLDSENEQRIQQAIESLHEQMTIVVITHRLSTIRHADVIHVMDHGRVVETGSWDELIARPSGRFRKLCQAQGIEEEMEVYSVGSIGH
jgi:ATP-binding cassette subfamily C protein